MPSPLCDRMVQNEIETVDARRVQEDSREPGIGEAFLGVLCDLFGGL